ncbi:MAG: hypothetical protein HDR01_09875 [Lachnospiraceae bacterium]|nr:hypothetical protein [Lachnospiraceae bacterium]
MIKPRHLEKIYYPTDAEGIEGVIACECGCRAFKIRYFGEFYDKNKMAITEYGNKYGQAVRAVCADCRRDYLLYDFALHGYDGLICEEGIAVSDEMLGDFITEADNLFEIKIFLEYDDEDQFLEEVVNDEHLQKDFHFAIDDRASIWSWVVIELKGVQSGIVYKDFVNQELA